MLTNDENGKLFIGVIHIPNFVKKHKIHTNKYIAMREREDGWSVFLFLYIDKAKLNKKSKYIFILLYCIIRVFVCSWSVAKVFSFDRWNTNVE